MTKLYPPVIENTIPACYEENGMVKFTIPFSMNRAVSAAQIGGFELKIKTVQTGAFLYTLRTGNAFNYKISENESYVIFYLKDEEKKLKVGQFYKIQLAYLSVEENIKNKNYTDYLNGLITLEQYEQAIYNNSIVGYYSSVGVLKYTTKPKVYIDRLNSTSLNAHLYSYTGYYDQTEKDISEKVYSYSFNLYASDGVTLVKTTGEQLHNNSTDTNENLSFDVFHINNDLKYYEIYYIEYIVNTINKMTISSPKYRIIQRETIDPELFATLTAENNFNNGSIDISLDAQLDYYVKRALDLCETLNDRSWLNSVESEVMKANFNKEQAEMLKENQHELIKFINLYTPSVSSGFFVLSRADSENNYSNWEPLYKFNLSQATPSGLFYSDRTIEQGKNYQYSIQQYNDKGLYSKRLYSNIVTADFEDMFLLDGEKQLRVRFNPKVSKYSKTILESKQETIGSKYPFIFRNGQVDYKEFSISGLISYIMDNLCTFSNIYELMGDSLTLDYTTKNIQSERLFKNEVLEWLNNGKPKMFKSPVEGNFIVRLMKVSLAPEDKLGRMLHTFSCTASEIAECTNENLQNLNILQIGNDETVSSLSFTTVNLNGLLPGTILNLRNNIAIPIKYLKCENMVYGDELLLTYENNKQESIKIGITGNYEIGETPIITSISVKPRYKKVTMTLDADIFSQYYENFYILNENGEYEKVKEDAGYNNKMTYYEVSNRALRGQITFGYEIKNDRSFSVVDDVTYSDAIHRQFIGHHDILHEISYINNLPDLKRRLANWYYIRAFKRPIDKIISQNRSDDNNIYYYGLSEDSDKLTFKEMRYPIGLRAYEPNKYYKKVNNAYQIADGNYEYEIKDPTTNQVTGYVTYYLKGKYVLSERLVGQTIYEPGSYFVKRDNVYVKTEEPFNDNEDYYSEWFDRNNKPHYEKVSNLTVSEDYVFEPGKFYRKTDNDKYTLSNTYIDDKEERRQYYYRLVDHTDSDLQKVGNNHNHDSLYVNAYVTKEKKYVYTSNTYYMQIETYGDELDASGNAIVSKQFVLCRDADFNIHGFPEYKEEEGVLTFYDVEYGLYNNDVIKYYNIKPILPHILHQLGTGWQLVSSHDATSNTSDSDKINRYTFIPDQDNEQHNLFIDFNNNSQIYENYEPWIRINNEYIYIDDTLEYSINDLSGLNISNFVSGNGVVVEVGYQVQNIDYKIENTILKSAKDNYQQAVDKLNTKLSILNDPSHEEYIDLSIQPDASQQSLYNSYYNQSFQSSVQRSYRSLIASLNENLDM